MVAISCANKAEGAGLPPRDRAQMFKLPAVDPVNHRAISEGAC